MTDFQSWIGKTHLSKDVITQSQADRFHGAIETPETSEALPAGIHWCLCLPSAPMSELGKDGHPTRGGFMPPINLPRRMWAASEIDFLTPLLLGDVVERQSEILSIKEKEGRSGKLAFVDVKHQIYANGGLAIEETQTIVFRETPPAPLPLPAQNVATPSDWPTVRALTPQTPLLFRYSALTFNTHRIHYDLPYTRNIEGYPALVVHGPLLATLLMQLASEAGELKSFAYKAISPAFCDQPLYRVARYNDKEGELAIIGGDGRICVKAEAVLR